MKKAFKILQPFLSNFKWYRKKIGGIWYKTYDPNSYFGLAGDTFTWTQSLPCGVDVIKKEDWKNK